MELGRVLILCATWGLAAAALYLCRKQSPLHAMVVAVLTSALIGTFFPVLSLFIPPATWRNVSQLSPELLMSVQGEFTAWIAGLFLACSFASHMRWFDAGASAAPATRQRSSRMRDFACAWGLMLGGAVLYALYVQRVGMEALTSHVDYAEKYLRSMGLGPLMFGLSMMIASCLWAEDSNLASSDKWPFRIVGAVIVIWAFAFISTRTYALFLLLGYGAIVCRRRRIELRRVHLGLIAGLIVTYACLESFSLLRGLYRDDFEQAVTALAAQGEGAVACVVGGSELSHPFITAAEVMHDGVPGELAGQSIPDGLRALMPLALDPDRPLSLAEKFVRANYGDLANRGGGTAFSIVAEAWLDFGSLIGPFAVGALFGGLLVWMERRCRARPDGLVARLTPYLLFYVAVHHRNEVATLLKQVVMILLAVLPMWVAADAVRISLVRKPKLLAKESV